MQYDPAAYEPTLYGQAPHGQAPNAPALNTQAPYGEAAFGKTPYTVTPNAQAPYGEEAYGETPYAVAPSAQAPYGEAAYGETPYGAAPNAQVPYDQTLNSQTTYAQTPYAEIPYDQTLYGQTSYSQLSYAQAAYGEGPYGEQNRQYDHVPVAGGERSAWKTVAAVVTAVLILMAIVLGLLVFTGNTKHSAGTPVAEEATELLVPPMGGSADKPATPAQSTPAPVISTTPAAVPPTSPPIAIDREPMVCIMCCTFLDSVEQFPPDGLCDYMFYHSLYERGRRNLPANETTYARDFRTFLNNIHGYRHTTLGLGFSFEFVAMAEKDLKVTNPSALKPFWNKGIVHAGIFDTPTEPSRDQTKAAIAALKTINRVLDTLRSRGELAVTAITVPHPELQWASSFAEDFRDLQFTPHMFISIGYYRYGDNKYNNCFIVPVTRHPEDIPPQDVLRSYSFDLSSPMYQLRYLYANGTDTAGLLGVSLYTRYAKSASRDHVDFYQPCVPHYVQYGSYTEECTTYPFNYSSEHYSMFAPVVSIPEYTMAYDNEDAFTQKLTAVKNLDPSVPFGLAVYHVYMDDYDNKCASLNKYGAFSRLKELRKLLDFFKANYSERFSARPP